MAFERHYGPCSHCGKIGLIVVAAGYIRECNEKIKTAKRESAPRVKPVYHQTDYAEKARIKAILKDEVTISPADKEELKEITRKPTKQRVVTGQKELFEKIWRENLHLCAVCERPVKRVDGGVRMFSHILSKGSSIEFMLIEENILIMGDGLNGNCNCHNRWEYRTPEMRLIDMWIPIFLLHDKLKEIYNKEC